MWVGCRGFGTLSALTHFCRNSAQEEETEGKGNCRSGSRSGRGSGFGGCGSGCEETKEKEEGCQ